MVWTSVERGTRLIGLSGALLANRLLWIGIALGVLALTRFRFRFAHHTVGASRYKMSHGSERTSRRANVSKLTSPMSGAHSGS